MSSNTAALWRRLSKMQRALLILSGILLVSCATGVTLLIHYWPFGEKNILETLAETVPGSKVAVSRFHSTYFLHPGCWADEVTFVRRDSAAGDPPLVTVQKLSIQANYHDLFFRPGYISRVVIDGLHIQVPPRGSNRADTLDSQSMSPTRTTVGEIVSNGALLEIGRRNDPPLKFEIHDLHLYSVGSGKSMSYSVRLQNPLPPGEVQSDGKIGPWQKELGRIPLSGKYKFEHADLGVFATLGGTLSSAGQFQGTLGELDAAGDTDLPNLTVRGEGHAVDVKTHFEAEINGTNGDVRLTSVNATLQKTPIQAQASILGMPGVPGKMTTVDLFSSAGFVQDILRPFVRAANPPMSGPISFRAHVTFPSGDSPFLKRVKLAGDFTIHHGRFSEKDTQNSVDDLSQRARGMKGKEGGPEFVESDLSGRVALSNAVAKFSTVVMSVPGAKAEMTGTFNVQNEKLDFHGTLKTDAKLSDTTRGIKAALLKPLDPLFKRKSAGASIPVEMTGTYSQPHFGIEVVPGKH